MKNTAKSTNPGSSKHSTFSCPHCYKSMSSANLARHVKRIHINKKTGAIAESTEATLANIKTSLENAATYTDNVSISAEEHITIRQHLDTGKQAIAAVEALLHQKLRALSARIASIGPQVATMSMHAAHAVMGEGGRFTVSSNACGRLPDNNLNFMVQQLGLGSRSTLTYTEPDLSRLYLLHSQADSVSNLIATSAHIQDRIESLSAPL